MKSHEICGYVMNFHDIYRAFRCTLVAHCFLHRCCPIQKLIFADEVSGLTDSIIHHLSAMLKVLLCLTRETIGMPTM